MKNFIFLFALLLPCFSQAAVSSPRIKETASSFQPKAFTANYLVFRNGKELGTATISYLNIGNGQWQLTTHTVGTGIAAIAGVDINEQSRIRWNEGKAETLNYTFSQKAGWKNKQRSIAVDAQNQSILSKDKDDSYTLEYQAGVLDRHAITVAIMQDLLQGKSGDLSYPVADRDQLYRQVYRPTGTTKLETAMGSMNAVKVQRIRESANGKATTLWLAADKQFVPLKIEQKESDGDVIEMRITGLR